MRPEIADTFRQADEFEKLKEKPRNPCDMQTRNNQDMICAGILKCFASGIVQAGIISYDETGQHRRRLPFFHFRDGIEAPLHVSACCSAACVHGLEQPPGIISSRRVDLILPRTKIPRRESSPALSADPGFW